MSTLDRRDYVAWLKARRAAVVTAALALARRAEEEERIFRPGERVQYEALTEAIDHLDRRLRAAWIEARRDATYRPSVAAWARANDHSYSVLPGDRSNFASLRR
jgi:hypothetical protein